jgi:hypothetical protein
MRVRVSCAAAKRVVAKMLLWVAARACASREPNGVHAKSE